ncbi:hypothetical protein Tcan_07249 [Toxocara canis]|uniref:Uncharacterized protein n=1 Tax=Toxocara canis TaxID=6265 RepID=A0A0B2UTX7_TOXCA|nr:hypothetical protein Tcan_07249 [Toxocara canis]
MMSSPLVIAVIALIVIVSAEETSLREKRQMCSCMQRSCSCMQITVTLQMSCSCPQVTLPCPCSSPSIGPIIRPSGSIIVVPSTPQQCMTGCNDVCQRQCVAGQCVPVCWNACNMAC